MLKQIDDFAEQKLSFGFETTLSGKGYARLFKELSGKGYRIHLIFLWLPSVELAIQRVADRVKRGGHHVQDADVRRRFKRGLENIIKVYRFLSDDWQVFDNRGKFPRMVAFGDHDSVDFDLEFQGAIKHLE